MLISGEGFILPLFFSLRFFIGGEMNKKGFTLIELMVVIIIIGILATIAIPKMFGMSAKAKASEVGPAVGTWSKLVQAYYGETTSLGNWASIGYSAPGNNDGSGVFSTTYIEYKDVDFGVEPVIAHWQAKAKNISETCVDKVWAAQSTGVLSSVTQFGCADLTPNFKKLQ